MAKKSLNSIKEANELYDLDPGEQNNLLDISRRFQILKEELKIW